nr:unnamed protein product [Callosobruchus analis]
MNCTMVTDCNALKATSVKKVIARWWLQLQEFTFEAKYRPGARMAHVDCLSRNSVDGTDESAEPEAVFRIKQADWVLSGQLTDENIKRIHEILSRAPPTEEEKQVYKNYALRDGRVYRITVRGIQWVVPRGMRHQVVKAAHDDFGHFAVDKTLYRLTEHYWFPRMRKYFEKYISCCIPCLYNKKPAGKREGYLHPIPKTPTPFFTVHVDHLGPFPKSKKGNAYVLALIDGFTKFVALKAVKSTKTRFVIDHTKSLSATYGVPRVLVSDQGSAFTAKKFKDFCHQNNIKHVLNAVATPRANGQEERLEEDLWDRELPNVQFAINNIPSRSTGKTPSQLLFGYGLRRGADMPLKDEVSQIPILLEDLVTAREQATRKIEAAQPGDLVLIVKQQPATGASRKLRNPYSGPMVVKVALPNDRYIVTDMTGSHRAERRSNYERTVAVDSMKPWCSPGGVSDDTGSESVHKDARKRNQHLQEISKICNRSVEDVKEKIHSLRSAFSRELKKCP